MQLTEKEGEKLLERKEMMALFSLLDDPDPFVQEKLREQMDRFNENHVPVLDELLNEATDPGLRSRVSSLIHDITFPSLEQEFAELVENGIHSMKDLERAQLLLGRFDNPTLRTDLYRRQLDKMAMRLEPAIRTELSPDEQLKSFVSFFFEREYFKGAAEDYINPDNSFLHKVLHRRRGIPISISMVLLFVAHRVGFPMYGVNMPMHFLIKYESGNESTLLDPFNGGNIISMDDCYSFLRLHGITPDASHFKRASEMDILARTMRNLVFSYEKRDDLKRAGEMKSLLSYVVQTG